MGVGRVLSRAPIYLSYKTSFENSSLINGIGDEEILDSRVGRLPPPSPPGETGTREIDGFSFIREVLQK